MEKDRNTNVRRERDHLGDYRIIQVRVDGDLA